MSFHIVCDSCTDLTKEDFAKGCYTWVPLTLIVDGEEIMDDETFDQASFSQKGGGEPERSEIRLSCAGEIYGGL